MTSGDPELDAFIKGESRGAPQESVFGAVDQRAMMERLDTLEDEELVDGYLEADFGQAERASTRSLEIGIRTLMGPEVTSGGGGAVPTAPIAGVPDSVEARRAFVLGGPARLSA